MPQHTYGGAGGGGGEMYGSYSFTTSALDGVRGQCRTPAALYSRGKDPRYPCTGGWVGPGAGLGTEVRGKISCPCRGSNFDHQVVQSVARHYSD
jgi:hypothetical protein